MSPITFIKFGKSTKGTSFIPSDPELVETEKGAFSATKSLSDLFGKHSLLPFTGNGDAEGLEPPKIFTG